MWEARVRARLMLLAVVLSAILEPSKAQLVERPLKPNSLFQTLELQGTPNTPAGQQFVVVGPGACVAFRVARGALVRNNLTFSASSCGFTDIAGLKSVCPLHPSGGLTSLMVAVLRPDQVPEGVLSPAPPALRVTPPADKQRLARALAGNCSAVGAGASPLAEGGPLSGAGLADELPGTFYQLDEASCASLEALKDGAGQRVMSPWSARRNQYRFGIGPDEPDYCRALLNDLTSNQNLLRNFTTRTSCSPRDSDVFVFVRNCHTLAANPTATVEGLSFVVASTLSSDGLEGAACLSRAQRALDAATKFALAPAILLLCGGLAVLGAASALLRSRSGRRGAGKGAGVLGGPAGGGSGGYGGWHDDLARAAFRVSRPDGLVPALSVSMLASSALLAASVAWQPALNAGALSQEQVFSWIWTPENDGKGTIGAVVYWFKVCGLSALVGLTSHIALSDNRGQSKGERRGVAAARLVVSVLAMVLYNAIVATFVGYHASVLKYYAYQVAQGWLLSWVALLTLASDVLFLWSVTVAPRRLDDALAGGRGALPPAAGCRAPAEDGAGPFGAPSGECGEQRPKSPAAGRSWIGLLNAPGTSCDPAGSPGDLAGARAEFRYPSWFLAALLAAAVMACHWTAQSIERSYNWQERVEAAILSWVPAGAADQASRGFSQVPQLLAAFSSLGEVTRQDLGDVISQLQAAINGTNWAAVTAALGELRGKVDGLAAALNSTVGEASNAAAAASSFGPALADASKVTFAVARFGSYFLSLAMCFAGLWQLAVRFREDCISWRGRKNAAAWMAAIQASPDPLQQAGAGPPSLGTAQTLSAADRGFYSALATRKAGGYAAFLGVVVATMWLEVVVVGTVVMGALALLLSPWLWIAVIGVYWRFLLLLVVTQIALPSLVYVVLNLLCWKDGRLTRPSIFLAISTPASFALMITGLLEALWRLALAAVTLLLWGVLWLHRSPLLLLGQTLDFAHQSYQSAVVLKTELDRVEAKGA